MALCEVYWDHQIPLPKLVVSRAKVTVAVVALLCFVNSYDGEFVFDDSEAIVNNKVQHLRVFHTTHAHIHPSQGSLVVKSTCSA